MRVDVLCTISYNVIYNAQPKGIKYDVPQSV